MMIKLSTKQFYDVIQIMEEKPNLLVGRRVSFGVQVLIWLWAVSISDQTLPSSPKKKTVMGINP